MSRGTWTTLLSWQMKTLPMQRQAWCWHPEQPTRKTSKQVRSGDISAFPSVPVSFISKAGMQGPPRPTPWREDPPQKLGRATWLLRDDFSASFGSWPQTLYGPRVGMETSNADLPWQKYFMFKVVLKSWAPAELSRVLLMHWVPALGKSPSFSAALVCMSCLVRPRDNKTLLPFTAQALLSLKERHYLCSPSWIQEPLLLCCS